MHSARSAPAGGERPQDPAGCATSQGPSGLCSPPRPAESPRGCGRSPAAFPPGLRGDGCPELCRNFGGLIPPPRGPSLPVPRYSPRQRTRTTQKLRRKENAGTAAPTRPAAGSPPSPAAPLRPARHLRIPRSPGATPAPRAPLPQPRRDSPGRAGRAGRSRSRRSAHTGCSPRPGAGARPARAAAALWIVLPLLLQTPPASPRSPAVPRRAAANCLISPPAPPLASQMGLDRGHGGRRGNALILLLGCILTSWWSCLKVRKAAETRNLVYCSYQSKGVDLRSADPFSCSKLAQVKKMWSC